MRLLGDTSKDLGVYSVERYRYRKIIESNKELELLALQAYFENTDHDEEADQKNPFYTKFISALDWDAAVYGL